MKYALNVTALFLLAVVVARGQTAETAATRSCTFGSGTTPSWSGLTAGKSTRDEVERALGQPVKVLSETLAEYAPRPPIEKIYVQYRKGSPVVERLELWLPDTRKMEPANDPGGIATQVAKLVPQIARVALEADASRVNEKGRLERYLGAPEYLVLTYNFNTPEEELSYFPEPHRVAFYSPELFEAVASALPARPRKYGWDVYGDIQSVQNALKRQGHYGGPVDGKLTLATRVALRSFQRSRNMRCRGDIDEQTVQALGLTTAK